MNNSNKHNDLFNRQRIELFFGDMGINNFDRLGRLNYSKAHPPLDTHVHKNTMEICYLSRGRQTYTVDNITYTLTGGDVYITFADEPHSTGESPEEKSILYWVLIDLSNTGSFLNMDAEEGRNFMASLKAFKIRKFKGTPILKTLLDKIILTYYSDSEFKKALIKGYITEFLVNIIELEKDSQTWISADIRRALDSIEVRIKDKISLEELSRISGLSLSRFKQKFKQEVGIPPAEYILREKIKMAGLLLKRRDLSITEIAYELGFSSGNYFATVFKRIAGKKPTDLRH